MDRESRHTRRGFLRLSAAAALGVALARRRQGSDRAQAAPADYYLAHKAQLLKSLEGLLTYLQPLAATRVSRLPRGGRWCKMKRWS